MVRSLSRSDAFFIEYCLQQKWVLPCITIPHGAAGAVGQVDTDTLTAELRNTCHHERINQVGVVSDLEKWGLNKKSCPEIGCVWFYDQFIALMFLLSWYIMILFFLILFFFCTFHLTWTQFDFDVSIAWSSTLFSLPEKAQQMDGCCRCFTTGV